MLTKSTKVRMGLMGFAAAVALAGCFGADKVASPGEGGFIGGGGSSSGSSGSSDSSGAAADCPTGLSNVGVIAGLRNCQLPNQINGNLVLKKLPGVIYSLSGRVSVGVDMGPNPDSVLPGGSKAILTVEPGVKIFGSSGSDFMIVQRGSQIFAEGTATDPIIFTSKQSVERTTNVDSIGQWGGLVLAGRAPTNVCPAGVTPPNVACSEGQVEGANAVYGGNTPTDNSGILKYVRVQHSGFEVQPDKELNGITFAGVGTGTVAEYIQVHNSSDDGIEMFGGTVNLKYIVLTGNDDDSFDTDNGWGGYGAGDEGGYVQFMILRQRENGGDRMFEMSSAGNKTLLSHPKIANATLISRSTKSNEGLELNSDTKLGLFNSVIVVQNPSAAACIRVVGAGTAPTFNGVHLSCGTKPFSTSSSGIGATGIQALFDAGTNNTAAGTSTLSGFTNGSNENGVTPVTLSGTFFQNVGYIGAVKDGNDNWWKGWTCDLDGTVC